MILLRPQAGGGGLMGKKELGQRVRGWKSRLIYDLRLPLLFTEGVNTAKRELAT